MAESYYSISSYVYVADNPLIFADLDGKDLVKIKVPANADETKTQVLEVDRNVAAKMYAFAWAVNKKYGYSISSAFRSQTIQIEMRRRWDAVIRRGLRHRPAKSSAHSAGVAFDFNMEKSIG